MNSVLNELLSILTLQKSKDGVYEGFSPRATLGRVFGGQVLGQALVAAGQTVPEDRSVHSLHGYFIRQGDPHAPIFYHVKELRDGKSFSTRQVLAVQKEPIFTMMLSFQKKESGFSHQSPLPLVPGPEGIPKDFPSGAGLGLSQKDFLSLTYGRAFETRTLDPVSWENPRPRPPEKYVWLRATEPLDVSFLVSGALLAYVSDASFVATSLQPHGVSFMEPNMQVVSLDHSMWFHAPLDLNQWFLYEIHSSWAGGGRGFVRGQIFDVSGRLVASTAQEGLIRRRHAL